MCFAHLTGLRVHLFVTNQLYNRYSHYIRYNLQKHKLVFLYFVTHSLHRKMFHIKVVDLNEICILHNEYIFGLRSDLEKIDKVRFQLPVKYGIHQINEIKFARQLLFN